MNSTVVTVANAHGSAETTLLNFTALTLTEATLGLTKVELITPKIYGTAVISEAHDHEAFSVSTFAETLGNAVQFQHATIDAGIHDLGRVGTSAAATLSDFVLTGAVSSEKVGGFKVAGSARLINGAASEKWAGFIGELSAGTPGEMTLASWVATEI